MQADLDRLQAQSGDFGDLAVRESFDVAQDEHGPVIRGQAVDDHLHDEVRAAPLSHWRKHLLVAAAGVAATLLVTSLLRDGTPASPTIVFTDLDAMPSVDFAVLRYGALR